MKTQEIDYRSYDMNHYWRNHWNELNLGDSEQIHELSVKLSGFEQPR